MSSILQQSNGGIQLARFHLRALHDALDAHTQVHLRALHDALDRLGPMPGKANPKRQPRT
eukprot:7241523-Lingulodinium_polyedra.AAC.1